MAILFAFFRVFTWLISRLPFPLLYAFSGMVRFFLHHVIRYRRATILRNLSLSFPDKSHQEVRNIMGQYYRNLADVFVEVIKSERISPKELKRRFSFTGFDLVINELNEGRSVIVAIGHCGNWEWMGTALGLLATSKGFGIVKPLAEKHFHKYLESLRHRLNPGSTIPFQHTYRTLIRNKKDGATFNIFAADQTPTRAEINYWSQFLNQDTPFYLGVEKLARTLDFTVVYIDIQRTGRGKYHGEVRLISKDPKATRDLEITEKYIRFLEDSIRRRPDNWLWSHRRWKFKRPGGAA